MLPHRLWLETVNVLRPPETQVMQPFTHQNLTEDPLIILRCDSLVFRYQTTIPHLRLPTQPQNFYLLNKSPGISFNVPVWRDCYLLTK